MKSTLLAAGALLLSISAFALDGQPGIHDPSTVIACDGKYYVFGTGGGGLMSDDGWTWRGGAVRPGGGVAPDVIKIHDRYLVTYAGTGVHTMWTKTLDPSSPDCKFEDDSVVAVSDLDVNAIDPSLLMGPDGRLWMTYGSYIGYIRLIELDPNTGKRVSTNEPVHNLAVNCEASEMIYHDGWYYLLATHGSCCQGAASGYNIRVGRSRNVVGPFMDNMGIDMLQGGGKLFCGSEGRVVGPGHFGLLDLGDGIQKFSCHYEADFDRGGASVLDIRPILWSDGWPLAGENLRSGTFEVQSLRTGTALGLDVEGVPVGGGRRGGGGRGGRGGGGRRGGPGGGPGTNAPVAFGGTNAPAGGGRGFGGGGPGGGGGGGGRGLFGGQGGVVPDQNVAQISTNWPDGNIALRMGNYMCEAQEKWQFTALTNAGGYPGAPYFKITVAGTDRALAAGDGAELVSVPTFTGAPEQLWRIDELSDGSWRLMPKSVPGSTEPLALTAIGSSTATLAKYDPQSDRQHWSLLAP